MDEKECSLRNEKLKANRASETEELKERLRIKTRKRQSKKENEKTTRGKGKVVRNR